LESQASCRCRKGWKACSPCMHSEGRNNMEKVSRHKDSHHSSYSLVILYKEDLEKLTQIFNDIFSEIEIEADGYKLDNIQELNDIKKELFNEFSLAGYDKEQGSDYREYKMCFHVRNKSTDIYISDYDDMRCVGVQKKIEGILAVRLSNSKKRLSRIQKIIPNLIILLTLFLFIYYKNDIGLSTIVFYIFFLILINVMITVIVSLLSESITNSINQKYSWEKRSFYQRNRDNILVGGICALFGTVIGGLLIYFITKNFLGSANP
jgi:hypothetical protein